MSFFSFKIQAFWKYSSLYVAILLLIAISPQVVHAQNTILNSRGYFTTPEELRLIKSKADSSVAPYAAVLREFNARIGVPTAWSYGTIGGNISASQGICGGSANGPEFFGAFHGGRDIYAKALAYHLTGNEEYANQVRSKILDLTDTTGWGGEIYSGANQCILNLSFSIPLWISAADLIEESPNWTIADKQAFQSWLAVQVYPKTAWASRVRNNNWGASGSQASAIIADYLWDSSLPLAEVKPVALTLTSAQAYQQHNAAQIARMNTIWEGDTQCEIHGIQSYGGIPDELRRGLTGCTGTYIVPRPDLSLDQSYDYQMTQTDHLVAHAEFLLRRGDRLLFDNLNSDGSGSILKSIKFIIANPTKSFDWDPARKSILYVAYRYYKDPDIFSRLYSNESNAAAGTVIPWGKLTHAFNTNENPSAPQVVLPPGEIAGTPTHTPSPSITIIEPSVTPNLDCRSDINGDKMTDLIDYSLLVADFGNGTAERPIITNPRADINGEKPVDLVDYSLLVANFLKPCF